MEISTKDKSSFILPGTDENNRVFTSLVSTGISFIDNKDKVDKSLFDIFIKEKSYAMDEPELDDLIVPSEKTNAPYHTFKMQKESKVSGFVLEQMKFLTFDSLKINNN